MRVCLISSIHPWVNPRLIKEADALAACGHDVFVVTKRVDRWSDERDAEVLKGKPWSVHRVGLMRDDPADRWRWFAAAVRARFALRAHRAFGAARLAEEACYRGFPLVLEAAIDTRADVFIAHTQGALPIAARAAARAHVAFGFDCEDLLADEVADGLTDPALRRAILDVERRYLPRAAYVTATSQAMAGYLAETYRIPMPSVVRNVFPLADLIGVPAPSERALRGSLEMVWVSASIGRERGLEDALGALARLPPSVRLTIVGRMLRDFEPRFAALVKDLGVSNRVVVRPVIDSRDLLSSLARFDVGLALETNACRNKSLTISNKLFLYLQAGLVLAATDTPGQREVLESVPRAGFVYPPGDEAALASQLLPYAVDRRAVLAAQTAAWVAGRQRYNWDRDREVFLAAFESAARASAVDGPAMAVAVR